MSLAAPDLTHTGRVLIVEDEPAIRRLIAAALRAAGFVTQEAERGDDACRAAARDDIDLIILDLMLPGIDGFETCRRIRQIRDVPIIIVSARSEESDKVLGLELGADDYVTKPFSPRELVSRVRANIRRSSGVSVRTDRVAVGPLTIQRGARRVERGGADVSLTFTEFEILLALVDAGGDAVPREVIAQRLYDEPTDSERRNIDVHVRHLRLKVEGDPASPQIVRTVRGVGYALGVPLSPA